MTPRGRLSPLPLVALLALACGCKKPAHTPMPDAGPEGPLVEPPAADAGARLAPARCVASERGVALAPEAALEHLEIGEAVSLAGAGAKLGPAAVGVLRQTDAGLVGSVAMLDEGVSSATFVDLGQPIGDAPAPSLFRVGGALFAAFYTRPAVPKDPPREKKLDPGRDLQILRVDGGKATLAATITQQTDESLAFDVADGAGGALLAWDEDAIGLVRGQVKIAVLGPDGKVLSTRIASPDGSDAEAPRVVARPGGYWLAWVARRPEKPEPPVDASMVIEGPGRRSTFEWLEIVALDAKGEPVAPVKRLTPEKGHVSLFELSPRASAAGVLDVLARDDDQPAETAGGRVIRVTVTPDKAEPAIGIVGEGVGRGVPQVAGGWLLWTDTSERTLVAPLDDGRTPAGPHSLEPALDRSRALLARAPAEGTASAGKTALLVAFPSDPRLQLRVVECLR